MSARAKAWFISSATTWLSLMSIHGVVELVRGGPALAWGAALLATAPLPLLVSWFYLRGVPRTSANLPLLLVLGVAGAGLSIAAQLLGLSPTAAGYGIVGAVTNVIYVHWYSRFGRTRSERIAVGRTLPTVSFETADGEAVTTDALREHGPVLLMFYRGNWCPLCNAQIREMAQRYREFEERDVTVCFVSPQPHANRRSIAKRFDVPARFLVDVEHRAAKALGIFHAGGVAAGMEVLGYESDTVFPTVIIADRDGEILFCDQTDNYRVRPEPDAFLAILDAGTDQRAPGETASAR